MHTLVHYEQTLALRANTGGAGCTRRHTFEGREHGLPESFCLAWVIHPHPFWALPLGHAGVARCPHLREYMPDVPQRGGCGPP